MTASLGIRSSVLARPLRIGAVEVPNRIMQTAHSKQYSDRVESDRETAYYVRRARGGCGLFVAGNHFVHPTGSIRGFEDAYRAEGVAASKRMTDAVHEAGAKIFVQLNHHGAQAQPDGPDGPRAVYAPSRLLSPSTAHATREMDRADIAAFVDGWALSAAHARDGGFDGVEIHLAHGYLLHQFVSPLYNARGDAYGGGLEGRTRFPREVLRAVRERVGDDFTVGLRIVANEFHPDGIDGASMLEVIARLRAEARIDFLDLAAGGYHNVHYVFPSSPMPYAWLRDDVAAVKAANPDVPVFGVGAARSVEEAEEVVASGIADMVALTRAQIADPDLGRKLVGAEPVDARGRGIRHCIRLNQGCLGRGSRGLAMSCTVNPLAGRELERGERPRAASAQRWIVVGGGPAGMRAAVELANDGHVVTLLEREDELGGQLRLARRVPGRESIGLLVDDLERELAAAGVEVRLGTEATAETLRAERADGIVVATGAVAPAATSLALGGAYTGGFPAHGTLDAFSAVRMPSDAGRGDASAEGEGRPAPAVAAPLGRRVAVVDADGTAYAAGIVLTLLGHVDELELITPFETVFPHIGAGYDRPLLLERLGAHGGFQRRPAHLVAGIEPGAVTVRDALTGAVEMLPGVDAVVAIEPRASVGIPGLDTGTDTDAAPRVVAIGDAFAPRTIDAAVFEAVELAYDVAGLATLRG